MIVDPEKVAKVIAEIAQEEIASRFGRLADEDIGTKSGPNDFVTEADIAAEEKLALALSGFYPGAAFIGEERAASDPSLVSKLDLGEGAFWIVDPLDGTRNFVQGRAEFGTIVALVVDGEIRAGWIYAIPDKAFAIGEKGGGVTWRGEALGSAPVGAGVLKGYRAIGSLAEPWKSRIAPRLKEHFETEPMHCSAYGYINLIRGRRDFAVYARCHPWDHAAGVLMLTEIGGHAEYLDDGSPYTPRATQGRPLLAACSGERWRTVRNGLLG
jgi:fructose-1,6-bisphosphatase/inositol monophosphatase family enzyme